MTFALTPTNAVKDTVGQMGSVIKSISSTATTLFKGWFTGEGPLARVWSGFMGAFDVLMGKLKTTAEEKPLAVVGVGAGVILVAILIGPALLGHVGASAGKAVGSAAGGIVGGIKRAIASLWRS